MDIPIFEVAQELNNAHTTLKEAQIEYSFMNFFKMKFSEEKRKAIFHCLKTTNVIEVAAWYTMIWYKTPKINIDKLDLLLMNKCIIEPKYKLTDSDILLIKKWSETLQANNKVVKGGYKKTKKRRNTKKKKRV